MLDGCKCYGKHIGQNKKKYSITLLRLHINISDFNNHLYFNYSQISINLFFLNSNTIKTFPL